VKKLNLFNFFRTDAPPLSVAENLLMQQTRWRAASITWLIGCLSIRNTTRRQRSYRRRTTLF